MEELGEIIRQIHSNLTGKKEEIRLLYEPDVEEKVFEEKLQSAREKDLRFRVTSVGPHRDDFCVQTNGIDIRKYGSQGQQRTAALSLKNVRNLSGGKGDEGSSGASSGRCVVGA